MRLHGSAKLVVPLPAITEPRANTWPLVPGRYIEPPESPGCDGPPV